LTAVTQLLKHLPVRTGVAVVVIQHLDPRHESLTAEILSRISPIPVAEVTGETPIQADHAYVIPPNSNLRLSKGVLKLSPRIEAPGPHLPIDFFFQSLAEDQKENAIGVVMSGIASDGTMGLQAIKAEGGLTFAQDPKSAQYDGMPRSAILSGAVDIVATPKGIAEEIEKISDRFSVQPAGSIVTGLKPGKPRANGNLRKIFASLRNATRVDFTHYKYSTIHRRISRRLFLLKIADLSAYVRYLTDHPEEVNALFDDILIHVTGFFRDPDAFESLKTRILPKYMKDWDPNVPFRIWVPGCSTGEEAYSIAIAFFEFLDGAQSHPPLQVFASDIREQSIQRARLAIYPESIVKHVTKARLRRFFERVPGGYRIAKWLRDTCLFSRQEVTTDPPFAKIDLISCRNLLIYFDAELQKLVVPIFHYALNQSGILWLGHSETISGFSNLFLLEDKTNKFYSKKKRTTPFKFQFPIARYPSEPLPVARNVSDSMVSLQDVQREADRVAIREYAPPGVVINDSMEILQVRGRPAPYLELASGQASLNLLKLARPEIVADLRLLINSSRKNNAVASKGGLILQEDGRKRISEIKVVPLHLSGERCFSIFFEQARDSPQPSLTRTNGRSKRGKEEKRKIAAGNPKQIERLLADQKQYQESLIDEYERTQEELTAANEELQSANEELQSTNEELETAKEELQSANEEMTTINDELQVRNSEMSQLTNDLTNLLASVDIPIVMVGPDGKIRRVTPKAGQTLKLISSDVGRPISDIKPDIQAFDMDEMVSEVMATMTVKEVETQDKQGAWYRLQVRPYRTTDNKIDGAVISLMEITALKRAAEELTTARDDARKIIETMPIPILVVASDRRVQTANDSFCEMSRLERTEVEGKFLSELGHGEWNIPSLLTMLEAVLTQGARFQDFEVEYDFPSLGRKAMVLNARRTYMAESGTQAALIAIEDFTVRKQTALQLKGAEEKFQHLLENARDGILILNKKGAIEFANDRVEKMFGYSSGELSHQSYELLVPDQKREEYRSYHAEFMSKPQSRDMGRGAELQGKRKDGTLFPVEISLVPLKMKSDLLIAVIIRDVSELRRVESERLSLLAGERAARYEAERANRIKDAFLATLSHELRTPLSTILSWTQLIRLGKANEEQKKRAIAMIEKSASAQGQLINDLLDVSRIQSGKLQLRLRSVDPTACISAALDSIRGFADEKSIAIKTNFDSEAGRIIADDDRLQQVFQNLFTNAIKFTPAGGKVWVRLKRIKDPLQDRIQIQVQDTGKGIKREFLPYLFERFSQEDSSSMRVYGGLGLGLSIVRDLVEMQGGNVKAESPGEGKGALFTVNLPVSGTEVPAGGVATIPSLRQISGEPNQESANLKGLRVLVVDDMEDAREGFSTLLRSFGAEVWAVATVDEALEAMASFKPDVLLCDIAMPGEDGFSLIRKVRALEPSQGGDTPAIALSAYAGPENVRRSLSAKFDSHLAKPVDATVLTNAIVNLIRKTKLKG
jgi:two-component system, chemotaxis family, CheB/CheR fusion protein